MVRLIGGGSSLESVINDINTNFLDLQGKERVQVFKDDDGQRRVLLGKGADGFYGLKVSQPGKDVYTADDDELVFNSNQNMFKIVSTGTLTVTTPNPMIDGGIYTASVAHNQSNVPAFMGFVTPQSNITSIEGSAGNSIFSLPYNAPFIDTDPGLICRMRADSTFLYADVQNFLGSSLAGFGGDWIFRYYIFQETAQ